MILEKNPVFSKGIWLTFIKFQKLYASIHNQIPYKRSLSFKNLSKILNFNTDLDRKSTQKKINHRRL